MILIDKNELILYIDGWLWHQIDLRVNIEGQDMEQAKWDVVRALHPEAKTNNIMELAEYLVGEKTNENCFDST